MAAWLTSPVQLHSSRDFSCDGSGLTTDQCNWYQERWHFWYQADHLFGLSTIAFFMSGIGLFIIGHLISSQIFAYRHHRGFTPWQKFIAALRYISYRGFHVPSLGWNSAPIGVLLLGAAGATFFFCMDLIPQPYYWPSEDFGGSPPLGTRSGWMALACMPFVFATASKTNWITLLTGVSHEKLQVFHRWTAYAFFLLALMHTFPFIVFHIRFHDMTEQVTQSNTLFYWTGIVALILQAWLTFASFSSIRNLGYEFFKFMHFGIVILFVLIFFWHCDYTLTSWDYFIATAAVYVPTLIFPWLRTCFEYGLGQKAHLFVEDNGFTRITIPVNFDWTPGQHCFLRFTGFGFGAALTSHPFTICSLPSTSKENKQSEVVFYIRPQGGFTAKLHNYALEHPGSCTPVLLDGPYGGVNLLKYTAHDNLLVIAGGSGAGWIFSFIEQFIRLDFMVPDQGNGQLVDTKTNGTQAAAKAEGHVYPRKARSLHVILATRDTRTCHWFSQTVDQILLQRLEEHTMSDIKIQIHITQTAEETVDLPISSTESKLEKSFSRSDEHDTPPSLEEVSYISKVSGRPQLPLMIKEQASEASKASKSMGVFVCGPITMQNDVRNAVAKANLEILKGTRSSGVYLHSEHFSWA